MISFFKDTKIKALNCRMCDRAYRSALGLLLHLEACGVVQEKSECPICLKKLLTNTFESHKIACEAKHAEKTKSNETASDQESVQMELSVSGRQKRKSTIKAEKKLKKLKTELGEIVVVMPEYTHIEYQGPLPEASRQNWLEELQKFNKAFCVHKMCKYSAETYQELEQHYNVCVYTRAMGYYCLKCQSKKQVTPYATEEEAMMHLKKKHRQRLKKNTSCSDGDFAATDDVSSSDSGSSGVDENEENESNIVCSDQDVKPTCKIRARKISNIGNKKRLFPLTSDANSLAAKRWSEFWKRNCAREVLFEDLQPNYELLDELRLDKLLPEEMLSMKFSITNKQGPVMKLGAQTVPTDCKQLQRFEAIEINNKELFMFFGSAIKCIEWVPLPSDMPEQYFCISYRQHNQYTRFKHPNTCRSCILIYKVLATQAQSAPQIQRQYGFCVPNGPIHCFTFLPSGGYDLAHNRLGVVAVGTVDSVVHIYALPIEVQEEMSVADMQIKLIEAKPIMVLSRVAESKPHNDSRLIKSSQCLSLCWSLAKGHSIIAGGFTNGFVAIWDIEHNQQQTMDSYDDFDKINVNMFEKAGVKHFHPLAYFFTGEKKIREIVMHYDNNGLRWLAVWSQARFFVVYDVRDLTRPLILKTTAPRVIMTDALWSPIWETLVSSFGEAVPNAMQPVAGFIPSNTVFKRNRLDRSNAGISKVDYNAKINVHAYGGENGDLIMLQTKELFLSAPVARKKKNTPYLLSTMDVVRLDGQQLARPDYEASKKDIKKKETKFKQDAEIVTIKEPEYLLDPEYKKKYALIFMPIINFNPKHEKALYSNERRPQFGMEPMMRINALRFCPNQHAKARGLLVVGYQNGFLRLVHMKNYSCFPNLKSL